MITINQELYNKMPEEVRSCFNKLPNPSSEEVRECFPEQKYGVRSSKHQIGNEENEMFNHGIYGKYKAKNFEDIPASSGNASRFFKSIIYQAKASKSERNKGCEGLEEKYTTEQNKWTENDYRKGDGEKTTTPTKNNHPTVKPIALMEYLINMVTPKGGTVLDPFMGSGSTGVACIENGFSFIGVEMEAEYIKIAETRINAIDTSQTKLEFKDEVKAIRVNSEGFPHEVRKQ